MLIFLLLWFFLLVCCSFILGVDVLGLNFDLLLNSVPGTQFLVLISLQSYISLKDGKIILLETEIKEVMLIMS